MIKMFTLIVFAFGLSASLGQAAESPFSTNDLAILFPLEATTGLPKQKVTLKSSNWKILTESNFKRVIAAASRLGIYTNKSLVNPASWYLVGIRYSPCTFFIGLQNSCIEQIRFVLQPYKAIGDVGFDDVAMHVVFNFSEKANPEVTAVLESFRLLKNQFGAKLLNKSLKPNEILSSQSGSKYLEALRKEVIEKHVNSRSASLVTFMGLGAVNAEQSNPHDWRFFTGDLINNIWTLSKVPTGHNTSVIKAIIDDETGFSFNIEARSGMPNLLDLGAGKYKEEDIIKILKPQLTADHNVDCASCHFADSIAFPVMMDEDAVSKNVFIEKVRKLVKDNNRVTETFLNSSVHSGRIPSEAPIPRMFGYLGNQALISQRTSLDSGFAAKQANELFHLKTIAQCEKDEHLNAFVECLYFKADSTISSCLRVCY